MDNQNNKKDQDQSSLFQGLMFVFLFEVFLILGVVAIVWGICKLLGII